MIPAQLIPGIFELIGIYFGIAFFLTCAGIINEKFSKCLIILTKNKFCDTTTAKSALKENTAYVKLEKPIE